MAVPGTGSTNQSLTFAASKKIAGKAHTSNLKEIYNETIPSNIQINTSTIFAEDIPLTVTNDTGSLYQQFSASLGGNAVVEYVDFYVEPIPGTTYDANDGTFGDVGFGGGDEAQAPGPHGYQLRLTSSYETQSSNTSAGTGYLINDQIVHESNGALQLVNPLFGPQTGNNYGLQLYTDHPNDGGLQIPTTSPIEFLVDYFNGVIFVQDYKSTAVPKYARGFIYIGKFADTAITEAAAGGGLDTISGSLATYHRLSGSTATVNLVDADRVDANQVTATTFSGSLLKLSDGSDYLIAGSNITLSTGSNGSITISSTGGGGVADVDNISGSFATYNTISGAAGDFFTIDADDIAVGDLTVEDTARFFGGITGSLLTLTDGSNYLRGGTNVTLTTGSDGSVTINSAATVGTADTISGSLLTYNTISGSNGTFGRITSPRLTGSLTKLHDGTDYIKGGNGVTTTTGSKGEVTISFEGIQTGSVLLTSYNANVQFNESPDGVNDTFTTNTSFEIGSQMVFRSGLMMSTGSGNDYTVVDNTTIQFHSGAIPQTGENLSITFATLERYVPNAQFNETPNGILTTFTVSTPFMLGSQLVFRNGVLMTPGASNDYTVTNNTTIEFTEAPESGENIIITFISS